MFEQSKNAFRADFRTLFIFFPLPIRHVSSYLHMEQPASRHNFPLLQLKYHLCFLPRPVFIKRHLTRVFPLPSHVQHLPTFFFRSGRKHLAVALLSPGASLMAKPASERDREMKKERVGGGSKERSEHPVEVLPPLRRLPLMKEGEGGRRFDPLLRTPNRPTRAQRLQMWRPMKHLRSFFFM